VPNHLIDHLVGDSEQRRRHFNAEQPCGAKVDDELELGRLYDRQVGGLGTRTGLGEIASPRGTLLRNRVPQEQFFA
jgi:hypothetical protein